MKKIILKCFLIIILVFFVALSHVILNSLFIDRHVSFRVDKNRSVLVLGDSRTECALDDSILNNFVNFSQSGQPYVHSYVLCREVLDQNPQIQTVLISFSNESLFGNHQKRVSQSLYKFLPFLTIEDLKALSIDPFLLYQSIINFQFDRFFNPINKARSIKGGFLKLSKNDVNTQSNIEIIKNDNKKVSVCKIQDVFLNKIVSLCEKKAVKVYFIITPSYSINNEMIYDYYSKNLSNISLLDYSCFDLPTEYYADQVHLNYHGAKFFSKFLLNNKIAFED